MYSTEQLAILATRRRIYGDGTFKMCKKPWLQLYEILSLEKVKRRKWCRWRLSLCREGRQGIISSFPKLFHEILEGIIFYSQMKNFTIETVFLKVNLLQRSLFLILNAPFGKQLQKSFRRSRSSVVASIGSSASFGM